MRNAVQLDRTIESKEEVVNKNESNCICHNGYDSTCPVHRRTAETVNSNVKILAFQSVKIYSQSDLDAATAPLKALITKYQNEIDGLKSDLDAATKPLKAELARWLRDGIRKWLDDDEGFEEFASLLAKPTITTTTGAGAIPNTSVLTTIWGKRTQYNCIGCDSLVAFGTKVCEKCGVALHWPETERAE